MRYEGVMYRPPGEWKSYLLQCTVGCSHNACTFCEAYKEKKFYIKPLDYVLEDIAMAKHYYPNVETVFICDGDAIILPMDYLMTVIEHIKAAFPKLRRITCYAGPMSTMTKTPEQLRELHEAGLGRAYLGVETGDTELLLKCGKGVTAEQMLEAGLALRNAGIDLWITVIAGLEGGGDAYIRNAELTAKLVNKMRPEHLSVMTYMPMVSTPMYQEILQGEFIVQSPKETFMEIRALLQQLELEGVHFTANHSSNLLPLKGTINRDTPKFIAMLDEVIPLADERSSTKIWHRG